MPQGISFYLTNPLKDISYCFLRLLFFGTCPYFHSNIRFTYKNTNFHSGFTINTLFHVVKYFLIAYHQPCWEVSPVIAAPSASLFLRQKRPLHSAPSYAL